MQSLLSSPGSGSVSEIKNCGFVQNLASLFRPEPPLDTPGVLKNYSSFYQTLLVIFLIYIIYHSPL